MTAARSVAGVKEHPILFSAPMVKAILAGSKTQTRRVARFVPHEAGFNLGASSVSAGHYSTGCPTSGWVLYSRRGDGCWEQRTENPLHCPFGVPGDRLWVRETWYDDTPGEPVAARERDDGGRVGGIEYRASHECTSFEAGCPCNPDGDGRRSEWRPSIFMPRWASRITLEVTDVRVERLQAIRPSDVHAEGIDPPLAPGVDIDIEDGLWPEGVRKVTNAFATLWDSVNAKRAPWSSNPWVWVVSFKRVTP